MHRNQLEGHHSVKNEWNRFFSIQSKWSHKVPCCQQDLLTLRLFELSPIFSIISFLRASFVPFNNWNCCSCYLMKKSTFFRSKPKNASQKLSTLPSLILIIVRTREDFALTLSSSILALNSQRFGFQAHKSLPTVFE